MKKYLSISVCALLLTSCVSQKVLRKSQMEAASLREEAAALRADSAALAKNNASLQTNVDELQKNISALNKKMNDLYNQNGQLGSRLLLSKTSCIKPGPN